MPSSKPVAPGLIRMKGSEAALLGGRRLRDGKVVFPMPSGPEALLHKEIELSREGTLWSFTVQRFRPKPPFDGDGDDSSFVPYAVGYVELPGEIIVESRIEVSDPAHLRIGMPMRLVLEAYRHDSDGTAVMTYAFSPANEQQP
jgi:uncharacterized OB-fold protein